MGGKGLKTTDLWWARELFKIEPLIDSSVELLHDDAIDELHSVASAIHRKLENEYRIRMGVIGEVPGL